MSIDKVSMVVSPAESKLHIRSSTRSAKSAILPHRSANQVQLDSKNILFYFHPLADSAPLLPYYKFINRSCAYPGPPGYGTAPVSRPPLNSFPFPVSLPTSILDFAFRSISTPFLFASSMQINLPSFEIYRRFALLQRNDRGVIILLLWINFDSFDDWYLGTEIVTILLCRWTCVWS